MKIPSSPPQSARPGAGHGGAELRVTIAEITTAMASRDSRLKLGAAGPLAAFTTPDATPDITLETDWWTPAGPPADRLYDSGGVWQLFRQDERLVFHLHSPRFGSLPYKTAAFSTDFTSGIVHLRPDCFDPARAVYPLEYPLDELLITNWLALGRGVEVHACAVVDRTGGGYLFAGHSGAGKTTLARQWCDREGVTVLSDDRVVLRKGGGRIWMHGTPWHGDEPLASCARAPLTRVFVVGHASRNELRDMTAGEAVGELFARSFPPPFSRAAIDFTLSFLADVAQAVPVRDLGFVPDGRVRAFVRAAG